MARPNNMKGYPTARYRSLAPACALVLSSGLGSCSLPSLTDSDLVGTVTLGEPVAGARVQVWRLDLTGERKDREPFAETTTDATGRFRVEMTGQIGNMLVESQGGVTRELWSDASVELSDADRLVAVIPLFSPQPQRQIIVSPFTTIAAALVENGGASDAGMAYHEAVAGVHERLGRHFGDVSILETAPALVSQPASKLTPEVRHGLILASLSLLVGRMAEVSAGSSRGFNTAALTAALVADASDGSALLDGASADGPLTLGSCPPQDGCAECRPICRLGTETLREDLAETLAFHLIGSRYDGTGLDFGDVADLAAQLARSTDASLFGDVDAGDVRDDEGPIITPLPSPYFDESQDVIAFDDELRPIHVHSEAARVDLASLFGGDCDRSLHKHVNQLGADDDNPLRWRFDIKDAGAGFKLEDVRASIMLPGATEPRSLSVARIGGQPGSSNVQNAIVEVAALRENIPEIAQIEGNFGIEIAVTDRLGNMSASTMGCWKHVPRAAPLHASPLEFELGTGSFAAVDLQNDDVATLFGSPRPIELAYPLLSIPLANNSGTPIYLTLTLDRLEGTFSRNWKSSRAFVRGDTTPRDCRTSNPPTCPFEFAEEPQDDFVDSELLPSLADSDDYPFALRVVDAEGNFAVGCEECRPGEVRLEPGGSYDAQLVARSLNFLLPDVSIADLIRRISIGVPGEESQLTGLVRQNDFHLCD